MSDAPKKSRRSALDALVRDAKRDLTPRIDDTKWDAIEARLLEQVAQDEVDHVKRPAPSGKPADISPERLRLVTPDVNAVASPRARAMRIGAAILAAAAAIAVFVKRDHGEAARPGHDIAAVSQTELNAGSLRSTEGSGEVRVGGQAVAPGHVLRAGEVLETTRDARAVLERPRKVTWLLEAREAEAARGTTASIAAARATVKSAGESLVLGLDDGAIEAQVVPVASGEAFAVDVAAGGHVVRVAVHGTHLRVARAGNRVTVDLTEGVVSIGSPPRTGSTYGTLVTAPSHVEFDAANLDATLRIDHAPTSVRAAIPLGPRDPRDPRDPSIVAARPDQPSQRAVDPRAPSPSPAAPGAANAGALATVPRPLPVHPADPTQPEAVAQVEPGKPVLPPRAAIALAVRDCAALRSRPENVRVTVTSSLELKIAAGGDVETARFNPPLLPEIQSCAAAAIYKAKLADAAQGSVVTIPIDFSY